MVFICVQVHYVLFHRYIQSHTTVSNLTSQWIKNTIRTMIVLLTCVIAISTPYFGSVLGTVGGLTDALQAFVLPPLICIQIHRSSVTSNNNSRQPSIASTPSIVGPDTEDNLTNTNNIYNTQQLTIIQLIFYISVCIWGVLTIIYTLYNVISGAITIM